MDESGSFSVPRTSRAYAAMSDSGAPRVPATGQDMPMPADAPQPMVLWRVPSRTRRGGHGAGDGIRGQVEDRARGLLAGAGLRRSSSFNFNTVALINFSSRSLLTKVHTEKKPQSKKLDGRE